MPRNPNYKPGNPDNSGEFHEYSEAECASFILDLGNLRKEGIRYGVHGDIIRLEIPVVDDPFIRAIRNVIDDPETEYGDPSLDKLATDTLYKAIQEIATAKLAFAFARAMKER